MLQSKKQEKPAILPSLAFLLVVKKYRNSSYIYLLQNLPPTESI